MRTPTGELLIITTAAPADVGPGALMSRAAEVMTASGCTFTRHLASLPHGSYLDRWGQAQDPGTGSADEPVEEVVRGAPQQAAARMAGCGRRVVRMGWSRGGCGPMVLSVRHAPGSGLLLTDLVLDAGPLSPRSAMRAGGEHSSARRRWNLAVRLLRGLAEGTDALYAGLGPEALLPLPEELSRRAPSDPPCLWWVSARLRDARGGDAGAALAGQARTRSTRAGTLIGLYDPVRARGTADDDAQARLIGFLAGALPPQPRAITVLEA